ncbi:MAG TPA: ComEC/Rec2 family competence protein [Xanthobacteraceae bacterium]|nr:ComEC/Rec2 family competence protein [Xanthobacteraceae bacterium]
MVEWERRGRADGWPPNRFAGGPAAHWRRTLIWPWLDHADAARDQIKNWVIADTGPGRLMPWLPVAFGFGIVIYFTAAQEPKLWAAFALSLGFIAGAILLRKQAIALPVVLGLAAIAVGFTAASLKTYLIAHPVLHHAASGVEIAGFVEVREERERSDRIVVRALKIEGGRLDETPERVRLSVRKGTAPPVGSYVALKARLSPPLAPLRPGGYDFARDLYFQRIGASGYVLGAIKIIEPPASPGRLLHAMAAIEGLRDAIDGRIRTVIEGDEGSIASALITGKRDAISGPVNDAMYVSSLAHVLSISGYHMAVVAGVVFFIVRALLALVPGYASRKPIKKWAAFAALLAATFYLVLSGAEVATQRSYIMTAVVLIGVMVDRAALTLRTLAVAALAVLLIAPEAVVHPSFQMSFAATLALIAAYQRGLPWMIAGANTSLGVRVALWGGREVLALVLASLVAGLATTPYAAFHFHRIAPYGVVANLLAMPIVSVVVMPAGLLALVLIPFGLDGPLWRLMGEGIEWMITVALWVAHLPGAVGRIAAFDTGPLLVVTAGLVVLCLLKTPLRRCGAVLLIAGSVWAALTPQPDVLVSADAQAVAVRGSDGRLAVAQLGRDNFAVQEWLKADGDARLPNDPSLLQGMTCDNAGCIGRLGKGGLIALARGPAAFEEDCRRAVVVVSPRTAPPGCAAIVIDRSVWRTNGAVALRRIGDRWQVTVARPTESNRPWAPIAGRPEFVALPSIIHSPSAGDARPRAEDLQPGN